MCSEAASSWNQLLQRRNQLLVSVRNAAEARLVVNTGVAVLDVKDPARGALGRADESVCREILAVVGKPRVEPAYAETSSGRATRVDSGVVMSLALGELLEVEPCAIPEGVDVLKVGLAHCAAQKGAAQHSAAQHCSGQQGSDGGWVRKWLEFREQTEALSKRSFRWIAVAYFDASAQAPDLEEVKTFAIQQQLAGVLIDSYEKTGQTMTDVYSWEKLNSCRDELVAAGMLLAIAGQIRVETLPVLKRLEPHLIAVRSAVCELRDRNRSLCPEALEKFHAELSQPLDFVIQK
ncbi:hypothetical protein A6X21_12855 [Planctopirus hydrillae]|uniref:(5-formylfuran-3-yl)methyl phosphate synthase n=1 Tax=Planctopirus hydrillae TaxID=1841610 RepID=A0A1C3E603_9PLAN|nr:hypothetical protein A6X21_12855 [Planctopirus hydrillae]